MSKEYNYFETPLMVVDYNPADTENKEGFFFATTFECPECSFNWVGTGHFSMHGITCPHCFHSNPDYSYLSDIMQE